VKNIGSTCRKRLLNKVTGLVRFQVLAATSMKTIVFWDVGRRTSRPDDEGGMHL
jgi:hypothetical protein